MTTQAGQCPFRGNAETTNLDADSVRGNGDKVPTAVSPEAADYPVADWVDVAALATDPYPTYARLRAESPVAWVPQLNKFLVTSYAGCHTVEQDQELFSANVSGATMTRAIGAQPMLRKDDPEHSVDRAPVNPVLRPKSIKEVWGPVFERNAEAYLQ